MKLYKNNGIDMRALLVIGLSWSLTLVGCSSDDAPGVDAGADDTTTDAGRSTAGAGNPVDDWNFGVTRERLDRVGRPEVTNFIVRADEVKVLYNADDVYNLSDRAAVFAGALGAGLAFWDTLDGDEVEWDGEAQTGMVATLLADHLVIDIARPCSLNEGHYFDIETAVATGEDPPSCGGRNLNDDVIDTTINLLVGGYGHDGSLGDGVDRTVRQAGSTFPYLAEPYTRDE